MANKRADMKKNEEEELGERESKKKNTMPMLMLMLMLMLSIFCHVDGSTNELKPAWSQSRKWRFVTGRGGVCTCKAR